MRCEEFYEKWSEDPNWCEKCKRQVDYINNYLGFVDLCEDVYDIDRTMVQSCFSERASRPLIQEKDPEVKQKAIDFVARELQSGNKVTTKDSQNLLHIARQEVKNDIVTDIELPSTVNITHGSFQSMEIEPNSVDLILTDPPYAEEHLNLWTDLSRFAARVLKPSRFLIAYSGQTHLHEVYPRLSGHLKYYWTLALQHTGHSQLIMGRNVICEWKPILIFQKEPFKKLDSQLHDFIVGTGREKSLHPWQQTKGELTTLIEFFTQPNDVILDPMCGSGTVLEAALDLNRNVIGREKDREHCKTAKNRLCQNLQFHQNGRNIEAMTEN